MNRALAMKAIEVILEKDFKYLYRKQNISINTVHLTYQMDCRTYDLQMTFQFEERWCDMTCFISPTALSEESKNYTDVLKTVNYINWNVKSWGRYYIDDYYDIAYALRLDYNVLETMPHKCAKQIECAVDYYSDLFIFLIKLCQGKTSFEDTKKCIGKMWGGDDFIWQ